MSSIRNFAVCVMLACAAAFSPPMRHKVEHNEMKKNCNVLSMLIGCILQSSFDLHYRVLKFPDHALTLEIGDSYFREISYPVWSS